jgi:Transcriptional regulators
MKANVLNQIKTLMPELSKGQRAIGQFILQSYDRAAYLTAAKLGEEVGVSESTVVRFANVLGYESYPELQDYLRELIRTMLTSKQRIIVTSDRLGDSDILDQVMNSDIKKLRATLETVSHEDFDRAVDTLISAKRIYIIGMRSSASLASFAHFYFRLIFDDAQLVQTTSGSEIFENLLRIGERDAVLAISFPRYSKRIINAVEYAKSRGASVISLTDSPDSPIARPADIKLLAKSEMASFVDTLVAPLSIINALIVAITQKKRDELGELFDRLETIWDNYDVYDKDKN